MPIHQHPGDIPADEFRRAMHQAADLVADYLENVGNYPVMPPIAPGDVRKQLPLEPPEEPESLDAILTDYKRIIEPNSTHWNHPGFMAYFAVTGSGPGIVGETLAAALNLNAMLWRTGPAATELEEVVCDWLRQAIGLPAHFRGHINDTASVSSLIAIATARQQLREYDIRHRGMAGRAELPRLTVYCSEHAHSSIDKAVVTLGIGLDQLRRIPADDQFQLDVPALEETLERDRRAGCRPVCTIATVGTTSITSIDPVEKIAEICKRERMWLHVDAAYAGSAAICPEFRTMMPGLERADSIVFNPHKWLFTPVDCSVLLVRDPELIKEAFSIVPEYLRTPDHAQTNLMDYGVQLGRRMRALKLWMVIRRFGLEGLRERIRHHCRMGKELAERIAADPNFELAAPVPFSTICFRARRPGTPEQQDRYQERLLAEVNAAGLILISHTKLKERIVLRLTIGNLRTTREYVERAWELIRTTHERLLAQRG